MSKYLTSFLLIFIACTGNSRQETGISKSLNYPIEVESEKQYANPTEITENDEPREEEVLDLDSVWLNDVIRFSTTQAEIQEKLGRPDSITTPNFECGGYVAGEEPWGDTVNIWHYQGTKIAAYKDRADLMVIRFRGWDCTLHHPRIILSEYTSLSEFSEIFPNSARRAYEWKNPEDERTYKLVRIAPKPSYDDQWILKFYNDKLFEIEYWIGC